MEGMKREGFVFYRSFYDAICQLKRPGERWAAVDAIIRYALDGESDNLTGPAGMALAFAKPQIDANSRRYENGKKGGEYGKMGGRPRKENPTETPTEPQENPILTPKEKEKVKDKEKEKAVITNVITNAHTREEYGRRISQEQYKANLDAIRGRGKQ